MKYKRFEVVSVRPASRADIRTIIFTILFLAIIVVILAGTSCYGANGVRPAIAQQPLALSQLVDGIITRSGGLNYVTEQDSEVFAFYRNTPVKRITDTVFLAILRRPKETRIIEQSWSDFFRVRTNNDPTLEWRNLQVYLEANLTDVTIFRIPRDSPYGAQYDLYAVGIFNGETVVGVQMFGVAT